MRGRGRAMPRSFGKRQPRRPHRFRDSPPEDTLPSSPNEVLDQDERNSELNDNCFNNPRMKQKSSKTSDQTESEFQTPGLTQSHGHNVSFPDEANSPKSQEREKDIHELSEDEEIIFNPNMTKYTSQGEELNEAGETPHVNNQPRKQTPETIHVSEVDLETTEFSFAEKIHHQTERLYDIIEEIEKENKANWMNSTNRLDAMNKLQFFIERVERVFTNTIDLPEFIQRKSFGYHPGYEYIPRMVRIADQAKAIIALAKRIVHNLPVHNRRFRTEPKARSKSSAASILEAQKRNLQERGKALDERMRKLVSSTDTSIDQINDLGRKRGLNCKPPSPTMRRNIPQSNSSKRNYLGKDPMEQYFKPYPPKTFAREDDDYWSDVRSNRFNSGSSTRSYRSPNYHKPRPNKHLSHQRNYYEHDNDWIEIKTKMHPQSGKPRHYGKINSFKNLFVNSFQSCYLYDPNYQGCGYSSRDKIKIVHFDGENIEYYREFEQGILIKAINNVSDDWDAKFFTLLNSISGTALLTVQAYTGALTIENFIQALEDLYYNYGHPKKYRNALTYQLLHEERIDLKNPKSLQRINALITKVLRAFDTDMSSGISKQAMLSQTFISECVKMTDEAKDSYRTWCMIKDEERNIQSLTNWLTYTYQDLVSEAMKSRHMKGIRSSKPPVLMEKPTIRGRYDSDSESESD